MRQSSRPDGTQSDISHQSELRHARPNRDLFIYFGARSLEIGRSRSTQQVARVRKISSVGGNRPRIVIVFWVFVGGWATRPARVGRRTDRRLPRLWVLNQDIAQWTGGSTKSRTTEPIAGSGLRCRSCILRAVGKRFKISNDPIENDLLITWDHAGM